jgi:hypothetical protein
MRNIISFPSARAYWHVKLFDWLQTPEQQPPLAPALQACPLGTQAEAQRSPAPQTRPEQQPALGVGVTHGWPIWRQGGGAQVPEAASQLKPEQQPPLGEAALQPCPLGTQEGAGVPQTPLVQFWPGMHSCPQKPQLLGSLS